MNPARRRLLPLALAVAVVVLPRPVSAGPRRAPAGRDAGTPIAVDQAASAGIAQLTNTWDSTIADFDRDGWPDILLGRHGQGPAQLWINDREGHFDQAAAGTFVTRDRHGCSAGDVNGDGRMDVFCGIGAASGTGVKSNDLWIQGPGLTFTNRAARWGVADPFGRGRQAAMFDVDDDGRPDLFVGNEEERPDGLPSPGRLFLNRGGSRFVDARPGRLGRGRATPLVLRRGDPKE